MLFVQRLCLIFTLIGIWLPAALAAQDSPRDKPAACTPAARVFGQDICREAIAPEEEHIGAIRQQYEDQGLNSDEALAARSRERLEDMIWDVALERRFGAEAIEPAEDEVSSYADAFARSLDESHAENLRALEKAKTLLEKGRFTPQQEKDLRTLVSSLRTSIAFYEERTKYKQDMPPEFHEMVKTAERGMARTMMREWKINRALYRTYGGRLARREGAVVPVDAYAKFLDYIRKDGGLQIRDPAFKGVFKNLEAFIAAPVLLPETSQQTAQDYFAAPLMRVPAQP